MRLAGRSVLLLVVDLVQYVAYGVPVGGSLEYTDEVTLGRALTGRQRVSKREP